MEIEGYCLATTYSNSVLQFTPIVSYSLHQHCLTVYANSILHFTPTLSYILGNNVLQLICDKVGMFSNYLQLLFTISDLALQARHKSCKL